MESFKIEKVEKIIESKEAEEILECIKFLELEVVPIGGGLNADVYSALGTKFDKVCFKKLKEKPDLVFNEINEEHKYQMMAHDVGVRTPLSLVSIETDIDKIIIMERIEGYSVKDIMENPELMPKKFNYDKFCELLDEQIAKMHNAGIYHRDLHSGNVMINEEGLPVVIDFGTATLASGGDLTYTDSVQIYRHSKGHYESVENVFDDDIESIGRIKKLLRKFK